MFSGGLSASLRCQPATVNHHDDALIGVACRDLIEKQLHALGVDVRQYQTIELASADIHRTVGVGVLVRQHSLAKWAYWLGGPNTDARPRCAQSAPRLETSA